LTGDVGRDRGDAGRALLFFQPLQRERSSSVGTIAAAAREGCLNREQKSCTFPLDL